jgi:hypothetical protein
MAALELLPQSWAFMAIIPLQIKMVYACRRSGSRRARSTPPRSWQSCAVADSRSGLSLSLIRPLVISA